MTRYLLYHDFYCGRGYYCGPARFFNNDYRSSFTYDQAFAIKYISRKVAKIAMKHIETKIEVDIEKVQFPNPD